MLKYLIVAVPILAVGVGGATAGQTVAVDGTISCVNDKWNETEPEKGHKLVDYGGRCIIIPDDQTAKMYVEDCVGNYEYLPAGAWKGGGTCTVDFKGGDTLSVTWEEGSQLKEYTFSYIGGTGKYKGAKGGGTYKTEELTTTLYGGRKKGKVELP